MQKSSFKFYWKNILLEMLPSRALFLPETKELLICDVVFAVGKFLIFSGAAPETDDNIIASAHNIIFFIFVLL